jgi:hypothetical protein
MGVRQRLEAINARQSPIIDSRGPNDRRRRSQARWRGLTLLALLVVVIVVVVLVVTAPGRKTESSSTSTSPAGTSTGSASTAGNETSVPGDTTAGSSTGGTTSTTTYTADLTGSNQVPEVGSDASGTLAVTVAEDGSVSFALRVDSITGLTVARLHKGDVGATGPTVFTVYRGPTKDGLFTGTVAEGAIEAKNLVGPLKGMSLDDLVAMIHSGDVYLNVGTTAHPNGEIRGQLQ